MEKDWRGEGWKRGGEEVGSQRGYRIEPHHQRAKWKVISQIKSVLVWPLHTRSVSCPSIRILIEDMLIKEVKMPPESNQFLSGPTKSPGNAAPNQEKMDGSDCPMT